MAVTENSYTGNGSTTNYSFTFPYLKSTDVQVQVDAAVTTAWQFANATTVQFNTAPANGAKIKILRDTNVDSLAATFYAGSSIKSEDLNDNYTQNLYKTQEVGARYFSNTGGTMTGDLTLGEDVEIIFEGATDDAHETKLTVADPTADRTITLPDTTGTVVTTGDTGTVAHAMLAGDAVDGDNIANDSINSEHYVDGSIDTQHIANSQITTAKIADNNVTTAKIVDANITTAKIAADAVNGTKIADDSINSEHYVDGSIDTQHIADNQITTAKLVDNNVTADKLAHTSVTAGTYSAADITVDAQGRLTAASSGAIATSEITDGAVTTAKLGADSVTGAKIADDAIDSEHYTDSSIGTAALNNNAVTRDKILNDAVDHTKLANPAVNTAALYNNAVTTDKIVSSAVTTSKIANDAVTNAKIAANAVDSNEIGSGVIDTVHIGNSQITTAKIADGAIQTAKLAANAVQTTQITDSNVTLAKLASDLKQTTISNSDTQLPTSGAVVDYVAAQIAPLGGLEVIATEVAFPNTQPSAGVVISISDAGGVVVNGSGVSTTGRTVGGSTVTINGFPASLQSKTMAADIGLMVSSTGSSQTYNYHKILAKEADVEQLSNDINDFAARYRVASSAPSSSLDNGDLWFDTANGKMMVYNGTNTAWEEVSAIGSFNINTISSSGSTGGGSATFNGSAYRFTLSNPPQDAQQLLVSINGVIQKPNSGTSQPSEGFAVSGNDIIFSNAPASGSDYFIITQGQSVQIGTPSNNTVSTAVLQNDAVTAAKIAAGAVGSTELAANAVITSKIADDAVTAAKLASGAADLLADASPQLGANLDTNNQNVVFGDSSSSTTNRATFGQHADLSIYHTGGENFIRGANSTSPLYIDCCENLHIRHLNTNGTSAETMIKAEGDGSVTLYNDHVRSFKTAGDGIIAYGGEGNSGHVYIYADEGDDNADKWVFRAADGSSNFKLRNYAAGSWYDSINVNGGVNGTVELYFNNVKTVETADSTLKVSGREGINATLMLAADEGDDNGDTWRLMADGETTTSEFTITQQASGYWEKNLRARGGAGIELFHDNELVFETMANGVKIYDSNAANVSAEFYDSSGITGTTYGVGTNFGLLDKSGNWKVKLYENAQVELFHHTHLSFYTRNNGATIGGGASNVSLDFRTDTTHRGSVYANSSNQIGFLDETGNWAANFDRTNNCYLTGHWLPQATNTYDLGATDKRWRNVYTQDLQLSNESIGDNGIDGTWGNYTIVEGESDLFLKNNRSGKTYKFNLTEVL